MSKIFNSKIIIPVIFIIMTQACDRCSHMKDVKNIKTETEYKKELKYEAMMAVFYKPECPYCRELEPIIESINQEYSGNNSVSIIKVNASDKDTFQLVSKNEIETVPTIKIYKKGKLLKIFDASNQKERTKENIKKTLDEALNPDTIMDKIENMIVEKGDEIKERNRERNEGAINNNEKPKSKSKMQERKIN